MAFQETCAIKFFPFVARLVLFAAFFPMGWQQVLTAVHYNGNDAAQLASIGVSAAGIDWQRIQTTGLAAPVDPQAAPVPAPPAAEPFSGRALYESALLAHHAGLPYPVIAAWFGAIAQFAGGILLLFGAFSRLSGFSIAAVVAGAFWMTSWPLLQSTGGWAIPHDDHLRVSAQLSLFVLALMILLVGPGGWSIDGMLCASSKRPSSSASSGAPSGRKESK